MADADSIEFAASIARVQTMADGGLRVVLDLSEDAVYEAAWLMQVKAAEGVIQVMARA